MTDQFENCFDEDLPEREEIEELRGVVVLTNRNAMHRVAADQTGCIPHTEYESF